MQLRQTASNTSAWSSIAWASVEPSSTCVRGRRQTTVAPDRAPSSCRARPPATGPAWRRGGATTERLAGEHRQVLQLAAGGERLARRGRCGGARGGVAGPGRRGGLGDEQPLPPEGSAASAASAAARSCADRACRKCRRPCSASLTRTSFAAAAGAAAASVVELVLARGSRAKTRRGSCAPPRPPARPLSRGASARPAGGTGAQLLGGGRLADPPPQGGRDFHHLIDAEAACVKRLS
jgi:hypothetical protein